MSVKGKNLKDNPRIVIHVQDGLDTVILEGTVTREKDQNVLASLKPAYITKYAYTPDWSGETKQVVFRAEPNIAHAWRAPRSHRTQVNFLF